MRLHSTDSKMYDVCRCVCLCICVWMCVCVCVCASALFVVAPTPPPPPSVWCLSAIIYSGNTWSLVGRGSFRKKFCPAQCLYDVPFMVQKFRSRIDFARNCPERVFFSRTASWATLKLSFCVDRPASLIDGNELFEYVVRCTKRTSKVPYL